MHIKDIVDYVKNEIHFSRELYEDNLFVTLRIEPVEKIIEDLEQKHKDNLSYQKDLEILESKANKYDSLVEKIKDKLKEEKSEVCYFSDKNEETAKRHAYTVDTLEELLNTEKE